jgi:hypothetical protein
VKERERECPKETTHIHIHTHTMCICGTEHIFTSSKKGDLRPPTTNACICNFRIHKIQVPSVPDAPAASPTLHRFTEEEMAAKKSQQRL